MKMKLEWARDFLTKGYAGPYRTISCHNGLLVIEDLETYQSMGYLGTQLVDEQFRVDAQGYVVFSSVKPVIDEDTRFSL